MSTDKVDTEVPSPVAGTLLEIRIQEDEDAEVGQVLAIIGDASAAAPAPAAPAAPAPVAEAPAAAAPAAPAAPAAETPPLAYRQLPMAKHTSPRWFVSSLKITILTCRP